MCVYSKPVDTSLFGAQLYLHVRQQNSRTLLMDTTQQTTALLLTMQCLTFVRTKLASYTTHRRVFPIINTVDTRVRYY